MNQLGYLDSNEGPKEKGSGKSIKSQRTALTEGKGKPLKGRAEGKEFRTQGSHIKREGGFSREMKNRFVLGDQLPRHRRTRLKAVKRN